MPNDNLLQLIERTVLSVAENVAQNAGFDEGFGQYFRIINPSLARYQHHQGDSINEEDLRLRYVYETALIHIVTSVFTLNIQAACQKSFDAWPVYDEGNPYCWYDLPISFSDPVKLVADSLLATKSPAIVASQICGQILDRLIKRYVGEFYTPLPIAKHLIDLSGLKSVDLAMGKSIADPACGGGIILTLIADKAIKDLWKKKCSPKQIIDLLSRGLYGFDIQPFAVTITKSLLIYSCLPLFKKIKTALPDLLFPNVLLRDALVFQESWIDNVGFDYIIGNPPYMSAKETNLDFVDNYREVIHGHTNLYQLFLWWAIKSANPDGVVSFLLPQSMLAGSYFAKLREQLAKYANLVSITRILDHRDVVGDTDQQMMAVCLKASRDKVYQDAVNIRIVWNGTDISDSQAYIIDKSRVFRQIKESSVVWVVSDNVLDYTISERLQEKGVLLNELVEYFKVGNGEYVWNQNKELLVQSALLSSAPLISSASIEPYGFTFPYTGSHSARDRSFSLVTEKTSPILHSGSLVLIQRVTPRKIGRRVVAGMPSLAFHEAYPNYFLENHVNYVQNCTVESQEFLPGILGWLNSDLVNFAFQLQNGTSQISVFELGLLPVDMELLKVIAPVCSDILLSQPNDRATRIAKLNTLIFDWFELGIKHRNRINNVLSRTQRRKK
jgi:adenine-specific DNA-methyltransferase